MPYIKPSSRESLNPAIEQLRQALVSLQLDDFEDSNNTEGNLNYIITKLLVDTYTDPISYANINDAMGVLSSAKAEFYRRCAVPYENSKIMQNGDVYPNTIQQEIDSLS